MNYPSIINTLIEKCKLSPQESDIFTLGLHLIEFKRGESLLKQGICSKQLFFIASGLVKLVIEGYKERSFIFDLATKGEILGFNAILSNLPNYFSAIALSSVSIFYIEIDEIKKIIEQNSNFLYFWSLELQKQNQFIFNRLNILGNKQIHGRFSESILYLRSEKFNEIEIYNLISRKELAELSAISLDSTMKIINELKNDKIIEVNGKEIIIKDLKMMVRLAQIG